MADAKSKGKGDGPAPADIIRAFQTLREEQRGIAGKIHELEADFSEHRLVIETLKGVDPNRRCFRQIGGVLVEQTVKDVLPQLTQNQEQIEKLISTLKVQLKKKGEELNAYREQHGIRIQGEKAPDPSGSAASDSPASANSSGAAGDPKTAGNSATGSRVLVSRH